MAVRLSDRWLIQTSVVRHVVVVLAVVAGLKATPTSELYLRCYKGAMDKVLCQEGYEIRILRAFYADNGPVTRCRDTSIPAHLCKDDISVMDPGYYRQILDKCNGFRACRDLTAYKARTRCNSFFNPKSDYVLLEYRCLLVTTVQPSTSTISTVTTTVVTSAVTTARSGQMQESDGQLYTVSENSSLTSNTTELNGNNSVSTSGMTVNANRLKQAQGADNQQALKIALPLMLIFFTATAIVVFLLFLKKRRKHEHANSSLEGIVKTDSAEGWPTNQCVVFTNVTYENTATLQISQSDKGSSCMAQPAADHKIMTSSLPSCPETPDDKPTLAAASAPYVDMTISDKNKNKFKAWFRKRSSRLVSENEKMAPACGTEPESATAEGIYSEPMEPCPVTTQPMDGTFGYSLQQATLCDGAVNPSSRTFENHYAASPVPAKCQTETGYVSMKGSPSAGNKMAGRPLPPTVPPTCTYNLHEHYSEIDSPLKPEDVEGIYSSPKNNKVVESEADWTELAKTDQHHSAETPADITYENLQSKPRNLPQQEKAIQKNSEVISELSHESTEEC